MKAIVQDTYGSPDVLQLREIDKPVVGEDEVLVRVQAAGVDQGVWHSVAGLPYLFRIAGIGVRAPKNPVPGLDVAGRVEAVGGSVTTSEAGFFGRLGYTACSRNGVPETIAKSPHFSRLCCAAGTVMVKQT